MSCGKKKSDVRRVPNEDSIQGCLPKFKAFHSLNLDSTPLRFQCENSVLSMFFEEVVFLAFLCSIDYSNKLDTVYNLKLYSRNDLSMNLYDCVEPDTKKHQKTTL